MSLMVSISGIRGILGESLTPEVLLAYGAAFAEYCSRQKGSPPEIIVGRDGRKTGTMLVDLLSSVLAACGADVRDLGVCPTPTVQLAVERSGAAGGISVTASHNPMPWNGLKFVSPTGMFLDGPENKVLWALAAAPHRYVQWGSVGLRAQDRSWITRHIDEVLSLPYLDLEAIQARHLRVVLDCVNAAGGVIVPQLLERLGCVVVPMNCDLSGEFSHLPEPIPENLLDLAQRVRQEKADLGIAVDPDVDRLVLITEEGVPYSEEYTVASAIKLILDQHRDLPPSRRRVVVNLSTTRAVEDIARAYGSEVLRTPVGEINVAKKMHEVGAIIGGEGSGGVILPAIHLGRDALAGIGLILQLLANFGGSLSELKTSLPQYSIAKGKINLGGASPDAVLANLVSLRREGAAVNTEDGVKLDFPDSWVHIRRSNTEPILRIIAEARTMGEARTLVESYRKEIMDTLA